MISSIVLAAGFSSRMGEPKALLEWGGQTLLGWQVEQLRAAGVDEVIVVVGHRSDEIRRAIRRSDCRVMSNPLFHRGRASSLRMGAKAVNRDADAIVVASVDQPRDADFYRELIARFDPEKACTRPEFAGHHGHPVIVAGRLRDEMMQAAEESKGLAGVLAKHPGEIVSYPSTDLCLLDINTPEEYQEAIERFRVTA
ncbi:MAG: nucleotidyltransferase family protein [Dehalococcoidia bacterium]|nr:nucleotidyltransferase family protein [Dehalococcoidia bacterium]